jgi:hypothetical protein
MSNLQQNFEYGHGIMCSMLDTLSDASHICIGLCHICGAVDSFRYLCFLKPLLLVLVDESICMQHAMTLLCCHLERFNTCLQCKSSSISSQMSLVAKDWLLCLSAFGHPKKVQQCLRTKQHKKSDQTSSRQLFEQRKYRPKSLW